MQSAAASNTALHLTGNWNPESSLLFPKLPRRFRETPVYRIHIVPSQFLFDMIELLCGRWKWSRGEMAENGTGAPRDNPLSATLRPERTENIKVAAETIIFWYVIYGPSVAQYRYILRRSPSEQYTCAREVTLDEALRADHGIVHHDSHLRKSGSDQVGARTRFTLVEATHTCTNYAFMVTFLSTCRGRGGVAVRLLSSQLSELGSIPGGITPRSSYVGIVPDDTAGQRVFSGISSLPRPCIPALLHTHHLAVRGRPNLSTFKPRKSVKYLSYAVWVGAAVAERLECSPYTKVKRVQSPAGSLPDFC
ncbi:hypothetical protein PR048_032077 [Dryococelus australis]|uniref:Uncharacterized protein n=1 Tax=Dryococelus australis TaxID=614101 RepID=A0ABQ9G5A4_9NEOP|nr:hypothetical protein PR048_032077 [Dryococelus australis]